MDASRAEVSMNDRVFFSENAFASSVGTAINKTKEKGVSKQVKE